MSQLTKSLTVITVIILIAATMGCDNNNNGSEGQPIPDDIKAIFDKALYDGSVWALRVVDMETGKDIYNLSSDENLFIGSVRKVFTMGEIINELGLDFMFRTPIHRQGIVDEEGVLHGDLILVAKGDLTMGGRRQPNNIMAVSNFDHNEADIFGNAVITKPNPLQGYKDLARQIAESGVTRITGEVIIDDRLFQPYFFRDQFDVKPIFVNDDVVDVIINPGELGGLALVDWRPMSAAFSVESSLQTLASGMVNTIEVNPLIPECFAMPKCTGEVSGDISVNAVPPLTGEFPIVQTFRISDPSSYARTILIEALRNEGIIVDVEAVTNNPTHLLPPKDSYVAETILAEYISLPFSQYGRLVLKPSYNIGSDTCLILWGLTQGVDNMEDALEKEREFLIGTVGISGEEFSFVDGSGGGETRATADAIIQMLKYISDKTFFPEYKTMLPILGVDGTLVFVTDFEQDPTLAGAKGNVHAKTGTFAEGDENGIILRGRALSGYIDTKSGNQLMFSLIVNNVDIGENIEGLFEVAQDQGTISAIIWRDN